MSSHRTRRAFLVSLAGLCGLGVAGALGSLRYCARRSTATAARLDRLDVALARIHAPRTIGRAYRAGMDEPSLLAQLAGKPGLAAAMEIDCPATRAVAIAEQIRSDFRDGDVRIEGRWVVSRSECIIAALRSA